MSILLLLFFFQAEDGIRDIGVTGVQTCALPIFHLPLRGVSRGIGGGLLEGPETDRRAVAGGPPLHARDESHATEAARDRLAQGARRSEERRVGKECRSWSSA